MKRRDRLEAALQAWFQLVVDERAGILAESVVVTARLGAVRKAWAVDPAASHATYLDVMETWIREGKPDLWDVSFLPELEAEMFVTLTWDPA